MIEYTSDLPPNKNINLKQLTVTHIEQLVNQTKLFYLKPTNTEPLLYKAGQYLTFIHPTHIPEARRSYSITSAPALKEQLAIGVKRVANGLFSRYLYDQVQPGDTLMVAASGGFFTLPDNMQTYRQVFFFAAGVGITPVFSLLKELLIAHPEQHAVLVYSNSQTATAIFRAELEELQTRFAGRFRIEFIYSNSPDLSRAHLYPDLLISLLKKHAIAEPGRLLSYICGPVNYQRMSVYGLRRAGVPADAIRRENFVTTEPKPLSLPPDTEAHFVTIRTAEKEVKVKIQYPETILQAARKKEIGVAYSCQAGVCGNCVARCLQGKVWHSYNEVLTDKDLAKGLVLTCVGHPVGGDVILELV